MSRPRVVVTVGTDHHPFDRLVQWVDAWARRHPEATVFVQHGSAAAPEAADGAALVEPDELAARMASAVAVVTHGGPSSIVEARTAGILPLVLARDPERGEHVDGHQQAFAAHQAAHGRIALVQDEPDLHAALDRAVADPVSQRLGPVATDVSAAVSEVGALIDDLLARRPARHPRSVGR